MTKFSVGVIGAGVIGRTHADVIQRSDFCRLAGIADPTEAGHHLAEECGAPYFTDHRDMLDHAKPDAVIVATPNNTHLPIALDAIAAGIAVMVEKPVASTVEDGKTLDGAAKRSGVPVLVGHHRRHNPIIAKAREIVRGGELGRVTTASILYSFFKPDEYFEMEWRRRPGGGPVMINLIHEIDLVRFVCGEIASVQAVVSNAARGLEVEDTAGVLLYLVSGAIVTISLCDTAVTPWSWDLAARESLQYPPQPTTVMTHFISGTEGSITLPNLEFWSYKGKRSWLNGISNEQLAVDHGNPYVNQMKHLYHVARGESSPLTDAADATRTLQATLAVHEAARTGQRVSLLPG